VTRGVGWKSDIWKTGKLKSGLEEHGERLKRLTLAFVGAAYAGAAAWVGDRALWPPDSSVRYVQLVSLLRQSYQDVAAVYPGAWLDPEARLYRASKGFGAPRDGKVYLLDPSFFPALVAPLFQGAGRAGLVIVPMVAGFATVWLSWRWLRQFGCWVAQFGTVLVGGGHAADCVQCRVLGPLSGDGAGDGGAVSGVDGRNAREMEEAPGRRSVGDRDLVPKRGLCVRGCRARRLCCGLAEEERGEPGGRSGLAPLRGGGGLRPGSGSGLLRPTICFFQRSSFRTLWCR
jgi:hypothetical protein